MDKLLTPSEVAEYLGVQTSTIYQWTHQGFIPHVKIGKFIRFKESDVLKWIEDRVTNGRKNRKIDVRKIGI